MRNGTPTETSSSHRPYLATALAAVSCAVAIAACDSAGKPSAALASSGGTQVIKFADCMRSHGVPNFPDPAPGNGGIQINSGINPFSPAFKAAQTACRALLPGGGPGAQRLPSERAKEEMPAISD